MTRVLRSALAKNKLQAEANDQGSGGSGVGETFMMARRKGLTSPKSTLGKKSALTRRLSNKVQNALKSPGKNNGSATARNTRRPATADNNTRPSTAPPAR